jgi:hypothetical protein
MAIVIFMGVSSMVFCGILEQGSITVMARPQRLHHSPSGIELH